MKRIASVLLLLMLVPLTGGQTPVDPTVEVEASSAQTEASIDEPGVFTITVRNTSPGSGTGSDPPMDVTLRLSGAPTGWQATLEQSTFRLAAGASATTQLTIAVTPSAEAETASIVVEATIRSGAFPPFEATGTASTQVDVTRDDSTSRDFAEFTNDYLWYLVGAGLALYIGSTVLMVLLFQRRERAKQKQ